MSAATGFPALVISIRSRRYRTSFSNAPRFWRSSAPLRCGAASPPTSRSSSSRAVQGIGGALLVPGSLAIISASFAEDVRGKAIGTWSGHSLITTALGPLLGGYLIDHLS
jgi:MFS family permease